MDEPIQPGQVVRIKPDPQHTEAMSRMIDCEGKSHPGWKTLGRLMVVMRETEDNQWLLCPICSDSFSDEDMKLPRPIPLLLKEAGVVDKYTNLHIAVSVTVEEQYLRQQKRKYGPQNRVATFDEERMKEFLGEYYHVRR